MAVEIRTPLAPGAALVRWESGQTQVQLNIFENAEEGAKPTPRLKEVIKLPEKAKQIYCDGRTSRERWLSALKAYRLKVLNPTKTYKEIARTVGRKSAIRRALSIYGHREINRLVKRGLPTPEKLNELLGGQLPIKTPQAELGPESTLHNLESYVDKVVEIASNSTFGIRGVIRELLRRHPDFR